jgi:hypothetical protein
MADATKRVSLYVARSARQREPLHFFEFLLAARLLPSVDAPDPWRSWMKQFAFPMVLACALGSACGGSSSASAPATPAPAPSPVSSSTTTTATFSPQLTANGEVPSINNSESSVTGSTTITFHVTKDASGNITSATVDFQVNAAGFPAGSQLTMAHIHSGNSGQSGGILVDTGLASGTVTLANGSGSFTKTSVNVPGNVAQSILANPGAYYFNIHSAMNPNGVARGQLDNSGGGGTPPGSAPPSPYAQSR